MPEPVITPSVERGSLSKRLKSAAAPDLFANLLAAFALWSAIVNAAPWVSISAWVTGATLLSWLLWRRAIAGIRDRRIKPVGTNVFARSLLLFTIFCSTNLYEGFVLQAPIIALIATITETQLARTLHGAIPFSSHVPGLRLREKPSFPVPVIFVLNFMALWIAGLSTLLTNQAEIAVALGSGLLSAIALALTIWLAVDAIARIRARRKADTRLALYIDKYQPEFAIHWDAAPGTGYQLGMWLPYLERLNKRFIVIIRNQDTYNEISALTERPVLLRKRLEDLDSVVTPSLKLVFYVNNAVKNAHMVRYPHLRHVQLNHGDSDKAPSYNPVTRMFDRNFVAGKAAIDRFRANGVKTSPAFFRIVGRPQVADIQQGAENTPPLQHRVLYAPTWAGFNDDSRYSSLENGPALVSALIARGCEVIFRPHPYTSRSPELEEAAQRTRTILAQDANENGRSHIWGQQAENKLSIVDCFNHSTCLISDISSVVPDYLFSEKPYAVFAMHTSVEHFLSEFPVAGGGYVIDRSLANLDGALDELLSLDSHAARRKDLRGYFLGHFDRDSYIDAFTAGALEEIELAHSQHPEDAPPGASSPKQG